MTSPRYNLRMLQRLHAAALYAFPPAFRRRHGQEMAHAFDQHCRTSGNERLLPTIAAGLHGVVEALFQGLRERVYQIVSPHRRRLPNGTIMNDETSKLEIVSQVGRDFRYAIRSFSKTPVFTLTVLVILGLGIGATTAMFSVLDALLVTAVPFDEPDQLVRIAETYRAESGVIERRAVSYPDFRDWRDNTTAFSELAIRDFQSVTLDDVDDSGVDPSRVGAAFVSPSLFRMLGVTPAAGRLLLDEDDLMESRVAVLSHDLWRSRYGSDPQVLGRSIAVNEVSVTVVGIAREGYGGPFGGVELWIPFRAEGAFIAQRPAQILEMRGARGFFTMGRLRPGATLAQAQQELERVTDELHAAGSLSPDRGAVAASFVEEFFADAQRTALLLFGAVGLVLLVACANVANLLLGRQLGRAKEVALRQALGAGRGTIARQLLVESVALGVMGGALGAVSALWLTDLVARVWLGNVPGYFAPAVDMRTLSFALAVSLATGLLFGVVPALVGARVSLSETLKSATRSLVGEGDGGRVSPRQLLVVGQVSIAVVLFVGAGLMVKSIARQLAIDPGFDASGLVAQVSLPAARYDRDARISFAQQLEQSLWANAAVQSATVATDVPLGSGYSATMVALDADPQYAGQEFRVYVHRVSPGYFETFGIPIVQGRAFESVDVGESAPVVIVSEHMVRRWWPDESPIGKLVDGAAVIGVAGDVKYRSLTADPVNNPDDPDLLYPILQRPSTQYSVAVSGVGGARELETAIRTAVRELDASLPVFGVTTMEQIVEAQVAASNAATQNLSAFAILALILAAAGLYGIMAYQVRRRTNELGIRIALGAGRGRLLAMVLRQGLSLVAVGLVIGLAGAAAMGRLLESQLYQVPTTDLATYALVAAVFVGVGVLACLVPATGAMRVDPLVALREE